MLLLAACCLLPLLLTSHTLLPCYAVAQAARPRERDGHLPRLQRVRNSSPAAPQHRSTAAASADPHTHPRAHRYLQDVSAIHTASIGQRVACCGDTQVKIVHRTGVELEVYLEVNLDRKPVIGHFLDKVDWDPEAKAFACSATDGNLYVHEILG